MGEPAAIDGKLAETRFEMLYRKHYREVLAYFLRRIPASDAEDAAAEVFTVAWRRFDRIPDDTDAVAWLFGVAHNMLSNHRRGWRRAKRLSRKLSGLAEPAFDGPETQVVRSSEDLALLDAVDRMRPADAELLRLAHWEKLSHRAIGEAVGLSEAAVSQRLSRARKQLAAQMRRRSTQRHISGLSVERKEGGVR